MSAPNVEAVPVSGRNRCGLSLTVKSTGERCTLSDLARRAGVKVSSMQSRWRHAGRPSVIDDDMIRPAGQGGHREGRNPGKIILEYHPHGRVTFRQIAEIHKDIGKSLHFFRDRWHRAGRPAVVSAALFDHQRLPPMGAPAADRPLRLLRPEMHPDRTRPVRHMLRFDPRHGDMGTSVPVAGRGGHRRFA